MKKTTSALIALMLSVTLPAPLLAQEIEIDRDENVSGSGTEPGPLIIGNLVFSDVADVGVPEDMRQMMRAWLLSEPQILEDAMMALQEIRMNETAAAAEVFISENAAALMGDGLPFYGSAAEAAVEIVKFSDYRCPFCMQAHEVLSQVVADRPNTRIIVQEIPILGDQSQMAANLALSVFERHGPEAFADVHARLMINDRPVDEMLINQISAEYGLDGQAIIEGDVSEAVSAILEESLRLAIGIGANGTPTFVIDGQVRFGVISYEDLIDTIDRIAADQSSDLAD